MVLWLFGKKLSRMKKNELEKKLIEVAELLMSGATDKASLLYSEIYPEYSISAVPDMYNEDLYDLYIIVDGLIRFQDFSTQPYSLDQLRPLVNYLNKRKTEV